MPQELSVLILLCCDGWVTVCELVLVPIPSHELFPSLATAEVFGPFRNHGFGFGSGFRLRPLVWDHEHGVKARAMMSKQPRGQASLSWLQSRSRGFEKGLFWVRFPASDSRHYEMKSRRIARLLSGYLRWHYEYEIVTSWTKTSFEPGCWSSAGWTNNTGTRGSPGTFEYTWFWFLMWFEN